MEIGEVETPEDFVCTAVIFFNELDIKYQM